MTRLWSASEPILVEQNRTGVPTRFFWRKRVHRVRRIEQRWQIDTDWWADSGRVWRDYLALTTSEGLLCVIYQDLMDKKWFISKIYD